LPAIDKLIAISSAPLLPFPDDTALLGRYGRLGAELEELLRRRNGFYAFESALHVFPLGRGAGVTDLATWNEPATWRDAYQGLMDGCLFFAEDAFGHPFAIENDAIVQIDPESGQRSAMATSVEEWARLLLLDWRALTGHPLLHEWQVRHVLQGELAVENLHAIESVGLMRFRGSIAVQIHHLPDGARLELVVGK
jgi:hypothetical protein